MDAWRFDRLEHRQALRAALDDCLDPPDAGWVEAAVGDVAERIEGWVVVGREPLEPVAERPIGGRRLGRLGRLGRIDHIDHERILDDGQAPS